MLQKNQIEFRDRIIALAKKIGPQYGVDWRLMVAAAILETGWGKSELARRANNLFGIKSVSENDNIYPLGGEKFRYFESESESFRSYGWLMSKSSHYAPAREAARNAPRGEALKIFVENMAPVYCPPDKEYSAKLMRLISVISETCNTNKPEGETK